MWRGECQRGKIYNLPTQCISPAPPPQMMVLELSGNQITAVGDNVGNMAMLRDLDLSGNAVTRVADAVCGLSKLEVCVCGRELWGISVGPGNAVTRVADAVCGLSKLEVWGRFGGRKCGIGAMSTNVCDAALLFSLRDPPLSALRLQGRHPHPPH